MLFCSRHLLIASLPNFLYKGARVTPISGSCRAPVPQNSSLRPPFPWLHLYRWMLHHEPPSHVLHTLNCDYRLALSLQWLLCSRVSEIPQTCSAASVWPFILMRHNDEAGREKERDLNDASCLLGVMEHTPELFPSPCSPKVSIKRQITGNSCPAPSTEITYACG